MQYVTTGKIEVSLPDRKKLTIHIGNPLHSWKACYINVFEEYLAGVKDD